MNEKLLRQIKRWLIVIAVMTGVIALTDGLYFLTGGRKHE